MSPPPKSAPKQGTFEASQLWPKGSKLKTFFSEIIKPDYSGVGTFMISHFDGGGGVLRIRPPRKKEISKLASSTRKENFSPM